MGFATVGGEGQFRELELGALAPGVSRIAEVVDIRWWVNSGRSVRRRFNRCVRPSRPVVRTCWRFRVHSTMCLIVLVRVTQRGGCWNVRHDHFGELGWRYGWKPCRRPSGRCRRLRRRRWAGHMVQQLPHQVHAAVLLINHGVHLLAVVFV